MFMWKVDFYDNEDFWVLVSYKNNLWFKFQTIKVILEFGELTFWFTKGMSWKYVLNRFYDEKSLSILAPQLMA